MSKIIPQSKNGKKIYEQSWQRIKAEFLLINKKRVQTWKAFLIIFFVAGFTAALALTISQDWFGRIFSQEQQIIINTARSTFEDEQGNQYGPIISNEVVTTIEQKTEPIKIKVELEGKANFTSSLHLYIFTPGTDNLVFQDQGTSDSDGKAEVETTATTLPVGIYDFKIVIPHHLNKRITNITWPSEVEIEFDNIPAGNLQDEDNEINALDWVIMSQSWGTADLVADINQDGVVNTIDWSLMNKNWGLRGD